jgi:hypothetical protein
MREITHRDRTEIRERLLRRLTLAQSERSKQPEPDDWRRYELEQLLSSVNWERAKLGKINLPMCDLFRKEMSAAGHVDYGTKLALYAAELVLEVP